MNKFVTLAVSTALAASLITPAFAETNTTGTDDTQVKTNIQNNHDAIKNIKEEMKTTLQKQKDALKSIREKMESERKEKAEKGRMQNAARLAANKAYADSIKAIQLAFEASTKDARTIRDAAIKAAQTTYQNSTATARATRLAAITAAKATREAAIKASLSASSTTAVSAQ